MRTPPFQCLFCLSTAGPFTRVEHPIPESLGNDDLILEKGFICDTCNQYFGSKVENVVINSPPFGVERVIAATTTKKGKPPAFKWLPHLELYPTDAQDEVILLASAEYWNMLSKTQHILLPHVPKYDFHCARLLLKMGLELLLTTVSLDPYSSNFNDARRYARAPKSGDFWQIGYGVYPKREDLIISQTEDEQGSLITEQLYQYEMGIMDNGDLILCFVYRTHLFACNLSNPTIENYVREFNKRNNLSIQVIETKNS